TGIHPAQFVLGNAERHDRRIFRAQSLVAEFLIERHIAVAVDAIEHGGSSTRRKFLDLAADGLIVLMMEWGVFFLDVGSRYFLCQQHGPQNLVRRAWKDIVRAKQIELLIAA